MKLFLKLYLIPGIFYLSFTIFFLSFFQKPYRYFSVKNSSIFSFFYNYLNFLFNDFKIYRTGFFKILIKILKMYFIYQFILFINTPFYDFIIYVFNFFSMESDESFVFFIPFTHVYKETFDVSIEPVKFVINNINYNLFFYDLLKNWTLFLYFFLNQLFNFYIFLVIYFYTKAFFSLINSFWFKYYIFFFLVLKSPIWFTDVLLENRDLWCFNLFLIIILFFLLIVLFSKTPFVFFKTSSAFLGELNVDSFELKGTTLIHLGSVYTFVLLAITLFLFSFNFLPLTDKQYFFTNILDPYFQYK